MPVTGFMLRYVGDTTGVVRVEDLLRSPALQLRLIAGAAGVARRVAWAHVSELSDPTPWLSGAEMIMSIGLAVPRDPAGQRTYLERLDDAGVSCLALSEGLSVPPLSEDFLTAAEERGFPVVEVPLPVPFIAVSQEVAWAVQNNTSQRLNAQLQVFGAVQWLAAGTMSTGEIFARLERLSGYSLYACTPRLGPLLDGVPVPPVELAKLIPATVSSPPTVPGGYVLPVTGPQRTLGFILAMENAAAAPAGVSVVQHIATVAALQVSMRAHEREMLRRQGAETLAEMLGGGLDPALVRRRLTAAGLPAGEPLVLAVIRPGSGASYETVADALGPLVLRQQDELYALLPDAEAEALLAAAAAATAPGGQVAAAAAPGRPAAEGQVAAGVSRAFAAGASLAVARREAQWAVSRAAAAGRPVTRYGDDRTGRWLTGESADLRALVEDVLGDVIQYDRTHAGDLIPTVRTWLEHDRQTERAARALHIHPNTLLYRVHRFEQLSGRSLAATESLTEVWLALRTLAGPPGHG